MLRPSEIRDRVLHHHEIVNRVLDELEQLADEGDVSRLRPKAFELEVTLSALIDEEDENLDPALRQTDSWGELRAAELARCHDRQRGALARIRLDDRLSPEELQDQLAAVVTSLRRELERERRQLLGADLLRDDLVNVAQSDG